MTLQVFVANTELRWIDSSVTYKHVGAVTADYPSQSAGRIWINNDFLYYADNTGQTRFIRGIYRGATSASAGRVFVNRGNCTPGQDLWWVGTNGGRYSVRGDGATIPTSLGLTISYVFNGYANSWWSVTLSSPARTAITASGLVASSYVNGDCSSLDQQVTMTDIVIPIGQYYATQSANLNSGNSYRISSTSSLTINGVSRGPFDTYCIGYDEITNYVSPLTCVNTATTSGSGTANCNSPCSLESSDPSLICAPGSGCECSPIYNICLPPTGGGSGSACNDPCTSNIECTDPSCPYCSSLNVCYAGELE